MQPTFTDYLNRKIKITKKDFLAGEFGDSYAKVHSQIANIYHTLEGVASFKYNSILLPIEEFNKAFITLYNGGNLYGTMAMNRIMLEYLIYLYADYLYPDYEIIDLLFEKGMDINQIKVNGVQLIKLSNVREELNKKYSWVNTLWKRYNRFIHPSTYTGTFNTQFKPIKGEVGKEVIFTTVKAVTLPVALGDIVKINNAILYTLRGIRDKKLLSLKDKGLWKKHKDGYYSMGIRKQILKKRRLEKKSSLDK